MDTCQPRQIGAAQGQELTSRSEQASGENVSESGHLQVPTAEAMDAAPSACAVHRFPEPHADELPLRKVRSDSAASCASSTISSTSSSHSNSCAVGAGANGNAKERRRPSSSSSSSSVSGSSRSTQPSPPDAAAHIARIRAAAAHRASSMSELGMSKMRRAHSASDVGRRVARTGSMSSSTSTTTASSGRLKKTGAVETRRASALMLRAKPGAHELEPAVTTTIRKSIPRRRSLQTAQAAAAQGTLTPTTTVSSAPPPSPSRTATTRSLSAASSTPSRIPRARSSTNLAIPPRTPDRSAPSSRSSSTASSPMLRGQPPPHATNLRDLPRLLAASVKNDDLDAKMEPFTIDELRERHAEVEKEIQQLMRISVSTVNTRQRLEDLKRLRSGLRQLKGHMNRLATTCEAFNRESEDEHSRALASDAEVQRLLTILRLRGEREREGTLLDDRMELGSVSSGMSEDFLLDAPTDRSPEDESIRQKIRMDSPLYEYVNQMMKKATEKIEDKWKARFAEKLEEHERALAQERERSSASVMSNSKLVTETRMEREGELKALREENVTLAAQKRQLEIDVETLQKELELVKEELQIQDEERSSSAHSFWQKTTDLAKKNRALTEELTQANQSINKLNETIKDLRTQVADMRRENVTCMRRVTDVETEKQVLRDQVAAVEAKFEDEKARREQFQVNVEQLTVENTALYAQMVALQTTHEAEMQELRTRYEERNGVLVGEMRLLQTQNMLMRHSEYSPTTSSCVSSDFGKPVALPRDDEAMNDRLKQMTTDLLEARQELNAKVDLIADLERQVAESEVIRRKLHNTIQELRGNVRVHVRLRPFLRSDGDEGSCENPQPAIRCDTFAQTIMTNADKPHTFAFDKIYNQTDSQDAVFHDVADFIQSAMDGYNVCIFAYGQTGSGKTHTMQGSGKAQMRGIIPRAIQLIIKSCEDLTAQGWVYTVDVSFFEIYNETIRDLLSTEPQDDGRKYNVRTDRRGKNYVEGLVTRRIDFEQAEEQVEDIVTLAACNRSVDRTDMNAHSSRSHSIFALKIRGVNESQDTEMEGSLSLVDLAGSERLSRSNATGDRLKEAQAINKSLSSLADVFQAIAKKSAHVPYRNSKLTYVLQPALSGDGKTLMMVNLSPTFASLDESLCSLRFAQQVSQCELGAPTRQIKTRSSQGSASSLSTSNVNATGSASNKSVPQSSPGRTQSAGFRSRTGTPSISRRLFQ